MLLMLGCAAMNRCRKFIKSGLFMFLGVVATGRSESADTSEAARAFVREHEAKIQPMEIEMARAWWDANTTGKDEAFAKKEEAENRLNEALANKEQFERLKQIHAGTIGDGVLARE